MTSMPELFDDCGESRNVFKQQSNDLHQSNDQARPLCWSTITVLYVLTRSALLKMCNVLFSKNKLSIEILR